MGGFNKELESNEDVEFCQRVLTAGFSMESCPQIAVVRLGSPQWLWNFYTRERWHGRHVAAVFLQDVRKRHNLGAVLFAFYTLICLVLIAAGLATAQWAFLFAPLAIWAVAPLVLSIRESAATGYWGDVPGLALLFLVDRVTRTMCLLDRRRLSVRKSAKVATA